MIDEAASPSKAHHGPAADARDVPVVDVRTLLAGSREVIIVHAGERYRLRITGNDKLILTK